MRCIGDVPSSGIVLAHRKKSPPGASRSCGLLSSIVITLRLEMNPRARHSWVSANDVAVVPDTCFGISALVDTNRPSPAYLELKGAIGLTKPYILVQPVHKTAGFGEFIRRNREQFSGYQFVSVPIGPCHGDFDIVIAEAFDDLITLASWPAPLLLAEFIAGASAVVGESPSPGDNRPFVRSSRV